ncbi:endonuclease MutS2 [Salinispira pacifica]|uniref:Endonuclease MutS2 n=1 Tax=Salinispira pacifica TaxID=1307761 RepID=V5WI14_9SPIO|nr:Smr/MutS family protein [Salinispira pacifica]AHC15260.1 Recombination inhibitory protein MutS2 [Salinispira pacifica]
MNQHSIEILEFDRIIRICRNYSIFNPVRAEFPFFTRADELTAELELIRAIRKIQSLQAHGLQDLSTVDDILPLLGKEGMVLEMEQLSRLMILINSFASVHHWLNQDEAEDVMEPGEYARLKEFRQDLSHPRELLKILSPYFDSSGRFREDEIPALRKIVGRIQKIHGSIQETARGFISGQKDIWSSDEIAQRDGRVVLALKSDHRGKVDGLIHGSSNSGQTIYIEPQKLLEENNALSEAKSEYQMEVHRILRECSAALRDYRSELELFQTRMLRFDSLQMRSRLSISQRGISPEIAERGISLRNARHPSLGGNAVPITIEMKAGTRILVLSGPNTGGKTVSMKTLGLLTLMHQSGMEIPAAEGSRLPLFSDILVDIGDEQSIDAGLSTFSAHLKNLSAVLQGAKDNALILLDELGSGTNPSEGSALSMAVMEHLSTTGVYAMVTTHHDALKAHAFTREGMENASVEFDGESLEPTYNIVSGVPGESHALDIAARVGMDAKILQRAREYSSDDGLRMQELIEDLRSRQHELRELENQLQKRSADLKNAEDEYGRRYQALRERELRVKEEKLREHGGFIQESRKEIESLLQQLRAAEKAALKTAEKTPGETGASSDSSEEIRRSRELLSEISRQHKEEVEKNIDEQEARYEARKYRSGRSQVFQPGATVRYRGSAKPARIVEAGKKKNSWVILAGSMKMTVQEKDLELVQAADSGGAGGRVHVEYDKGGGDTASGGRQSSGKDQSGSIQPSLTLDIRGRRLEDALKELERFMDGATVQGMNFVAVIHGKGTGVLQNGVHEFIKSNYEIQSIQFAPPEDGGFGKSYVYL